MKIKKINKIILIRKNSEVLIMEIHSFYDLDKEYQKLANANTDISIDC